MKSQRRASVTKKKSKFSSKRDYIRQGKGWTSLYIKTPSTLPDTMFVRLDYSELVNITAAGLITDFIFRGNSCFAPTVAGHQPMGFDQFAAFYTRYRVTACGIDVSVIDLGAPVGAMAIVPSTDGTAIASFNVALETPRSKHTKFLATMSRTSERLKQYRTTREIFGLTSKNLYDDDYAAPVTSSPLEVWYYHMVYVVQAVTVNVQMLAKLNYYVEFFDRAQLPLS